MTAPLRFVKGQGTGNDFVLYADPDGERPLSPSRVAELADRRFGVGGDGVIRAVRSSAFAPGAAALDEDASAEWFMDYRNADGGVAEMCGNGIRVFARFLQSEGLLELGDETVAIGTRAGVRAVRAEGDGYAVDLGPFAIDEADGPIVAASGLEVPRPGLGIDVGNPHVVVALASDEELDALDLGAAPALEPVPTAGANVEFVVPGDPLVIGGVGRVRMRVHERGSGETLSCGTGAAAAALAVRHWAGAGAPDEWRVDVPGGVLGVRVVEAGEDGMPRVELSGPAELVYEGTFARA